MWAGCLFSMGIASVCSTCESKLMVRLYTRSHADSFEIKVTIVNTTLIQHQLVTNNWFPILIVEDMVCPTRKQPEVTHSQMSEYH